MKFMSNREERILIRFIRCRDEGSIFELKVRRQSFTNIFFYYRLFSTAFRYNANNFIISSYNTDSKEYGIIDMNVVVFMHLINLILYKLRYE